MAGELKHKDVGPELTYAEYHATDSHTIDGVDAGTVIAGKATLAEVKADTDIATVITNSHASGSDNQVIPDELADLSDDATHRLVTDTEKSTWNGKTDLTTVKADTDVASAISLKHAQGTDQGLDTGGANATTAAEVKGAVTNSHASGSDNQDLTGLVPYSGATGDVALGAHSLGCAGVTATGNVTGKTLVGDDLILWDTAEESPGDPSISMVSGDVANSLTLSTDGTVAEIVSNNKMFHFRTGENIVRFIKSLYEYWFTIDLSGVNPQLTSSTGEIGFDNENLTTTGNITAATLKATNLSDGKIPYHIDDATGLADGPTKTDVDSAVSLKHTQGTDQGLDTGGANAVTAAQAKAGYTHSGTSHAPSDAVSLATVKADSDIADAISNSHSAVTVSAPISLSGQALSLVNDAAGTITEIDTGALANSDTVIPTSKAVTTAIAGVSGGGVALVDNLKLVVNAAVNKLDVFTKSGGAAPDTTDFLTVSIPDGSGLVARTRKAAYLSGTSQFILADATAYWGIVSGTDKIKLHTYDIWDGTGIVHALSRFAGFLNVPTTTTPGDDDFFLLEDGSTYTRDATHFCICTGHVWANYTTGNTPDWTFYDGTTSKELAPMVVWNPKSNYGATGSLATTVISASDIAEYSAISFIVKQSGFYDLNSYVATFADVASVALTEARIKTGSATYGSAIERAVGRVYDTQAIANVASSAEEIYLEAGDTVHLGLLVTVTGAGNRYLYGDSSYKRQTCLNARRID